MTGRLEQPVEVSQEWTEAMEVLTLVNASAVTTEQ